MGRMNSSGESWQQSAQDPEGLEWPASDRAEQELTVNVKHPLKEGAAEEKSLSYTERLWGR